MIGQLVENDKTRMALLIVFEWIFYNSKLKMKKILYLFTLLVISCTKPEPTPLETALAFVENEDSYKLISYKVDTITYKDLRDSLKNDMFFYKPELDDFKARRNEVFTIDFTDYSYSPEIMEKKIMEEGFGTGFGWIRENVRIADSLISIWEDVPEYSYDMMRTYCIFGLKRSEVYNFERSVPAYYNFFKSMEHELSYEDKYRRFESIMEKDSTSTAEYKVEHTFSIHNKSINKDIEMFDIVSFDTDLNVVRKSPAVPLF